MKTIEEISWQVSEKTYRADSALSYSMLSKYEREGFSAIKHLNDKISTPSLTHGSIVDEMITGTSESFNNRYIIGKMPELSPTIKPIMDDMVATFGNDYKKFDEIPFSGVLGVIDNHGYQPRYKDDTKIAKIREYGKEYYDIMTLANGREFITEQQYEDAAKCVKALRESPVVGKYFAPSTSKSQKYYQLKFKTELDGVMVRCMADVIVVIPDKKLVIPVDLKTSGHPEYQFPDSFCTWRYDIQSRLYWRIIRKVMNENGMEDWKLADYTFVVVNKETLTPLAWKFPLTQCVGTIQNKYRKWFRDPIVIARELKWYIDNPGTVVPIGVTVEKPNVLEGFERVD